MTWIFKIAQPDSFMHLNNSHKNNFAIIGKWKDYTPASEVYAKGGMHVSYGGSYFYLDHINATTEEEALRLVYGWLKRRYKVDAKDVYMDAPVLNGNSYLERHKRKLAYKANKPKKPSIPTLVASKMHTTSSQTCSLYHYYVDPDHNPDSDVEKIFLTVDDAKRYLREMDEDFKIILDYCKKYITEYNITNKNKINALVKRFFHPFEEKYYPLTYVLSDTGLNDYDIPERIFELYDERRYHVLLEDPWDEVKPSNHYDIEVHDDCLTY